MDNREATTACSGRAVEDDRAECGREVEAGDWRVGDARGEVRAVGERARRGSGDRHALPRVGVHLHAEEVGLVGAISLRVA